MKLTATKKLSDSWNKISDKRKMLYSYSVLYLLAISIFFRPFFSSGYSFVRGVDGRDLFYPDLVFLGRWMRETLDGFFHGNFTIPFYDLSIGWGGRTIPDAIDIPNLLVSPFVTINTAETIYNTLIFVRIYLAGLSFLYLCRYFKKKPVYAVSGALVYLFSAYTIYAELSFPGFANTMIQLPLLIVGAEKVMRRERSVGFVFAVAYTALYGCHTIYVQTLLIAIFCVVRLFTIYPKGKRASAFVRVFFSGLAKYLLGLGIAAVFLLPACFAMFTAARMGFNNLHISGNLLIHLRYFLKRFLALISPVTVNEWDWGLDYPAYAAIFFVALVVLYTSKKGEKRALKWLMGIGLVMLFCPVFGWIFQVFQYVDNRWVFALALLAGFAVADCLPEMYRLTRKQIAICFGVLMLACVLAVFPSSVRSSVYGLVGVAFLGITLLFFVLFGEAQGNGHRLRSALCLLLICVNIGANSAFLCSDETMGWASAFMPNWYQTYMTELATESDPLAIRELYDTTKGRVDSTKLTYNWAKMYGLPGTLIYYTLANGNVVDFLLNMEDSCNVQYFKLHSIDQRTIQSTLLSVYQQYEPEGSGQYVPYGYRKTWLTALDNYIFQNDYALPWGYTYEDTISYETLEGLNGVQKQEVLIQAAAVENGSQKDLSSITMTEEQLPYTAECQGCTWADGILDVSEDGGIIRLSADLKGGREYYIRLKGFRIDGYGSEYLAISTFASFDVTVQSGNISKSGRVMDKAYPWYYGRENYLFCLGCQEEDRDSAFFIIPVEGIFQLEDIELIALPLTDYPQWVEKLREEPLENIKIETNTISGTVDLSGNKLLCMTVPYENGWTAYVDGKEAEIKKVNYAFMGLELSAGHHEIVFRYSYPGFRLGVLVSFVSLAVLVAYLIISRKNKRAKKGWEPFGVLADGQTGSAVEGEKHDSI